MTLGIRLCHVILFVLVRHCKDFLKYFCFGSMSIIIIQLNIKKKKFQYIMIKMDIKKTKKLTRAFSIKYFSLF